MQKKPQFVYYFNGSPLTGRVFKIYNIFPHGFEGVLTL